MSILAPADSTGAFAVGAVDYKNYTTGPQESFSSQGPTNDGRIKPDIAAPDGVDTFSYGAGSSFGTSFAAPHVAGAACLLLSFNSKLKPGDLEKNLQTNAIDMGSAGKDNIYGYGRLNLPPTAPSGVIAKALSTTQISWQWSTGTFTNSNITGYNVYDAVSGLKKQKILSVNTSYWIEADLSTNTYYSRNITAFSDTSESDPNGVSRYTLTYAPFNLVVSTFGMHNINLAWSGEMNSYFIIDRSTDNLNRTVILSTSAQVTGTTYTDKNLLPATSYYYRIFAANGDGLAAKNHAAVSQKTRSFPSSITILTSTSTAAQEQKITRPGLGDIKVQVPPGGISLNGYIVIDTNAQNYPNEISKSDLDNAEAKLTARKSKLINNSVIRLGLYSLDGSTVTANFLKPFKLIISYPDPGNTGRVDNTTFHNEAGFLKIVTLNKNTLLWEEVPGSALDTVKKNVSADISHFSIYALAIVLSAGSDLSEVLVYPNPYVPGDTSGHGDSAMGKGVVFEKLTGKAVLKIFNIAGELVKEVKESDIDSSGIYIWDTKNSDGAAAASGVYIYFITNPDDATQKKAGKFSIIK
ncbi:MAG: S8 family serine peptidase [Elusimicrobia bacterium]|nr:S8 family serine peptidase [Candidatus Liberimonas magnetica]